MAAVVVVVVVVVVVASSSSVVAVVVVAAAAVEQQRILLPRGNSEAYSYSRRCCNCAVAAARNAVAAVPAAAAVPAVAAVSSTRSFSTSSSTSVRKVQVFATIRGVSTIGFRAFKLFVLMEIWMELTSKYDVFLHEDNDDFNDKTLSAAEGEASEQKHQKSLERWKSGG